MTANETPDALDHDGDGHKGGSKPKLVWIVTRAKGIHQVPTSQVDGKISNGKGRRADDKDLHIAGIIGAPDEEN